MGKYLTVILGLAAMVFGFWGILATWPLAWRAILAVVPMTFVLGGLLAVIVGFSEIRDSLTAPTASQPTGNPVTKP